MHWLGLIKIQNGKVLDMLAKALISPSFESFWKIKTHQKKIEKSLHGNKVLSFYFIDSFEK